MLILKPVGGVIETISTAAQEAAKNYLDFLKYKAQLEAQRPQYPTTYQPVTYQPATYQVPTVPTVPTVPRELLYLLGAGALLIVLLLMLKE